MKINTSYKAKIHASKDSGKHVVPEGECRQALKKTVEIYRHAVDFFINVVMEYWDDISVIKDSKQKVAFIEKLTVVSKKRKTVPAPFGEGEFYKFPAYYRRAAISKALGKVSSYKSNLANWKADPKGKKPSAPVCGYEYPALYKGNCFKREGEYTALIKVFIHNTWDWVSVKMRKSDTLYMKKHCAYRTPKSPTLRRRGKSWYLDFAFEEKVTLDDTDVFGKTVLAVDLGINNPATCIAMSASGTILGRHFLKLPKEQDSLRHALGVLKKAQSCGSKKTPRLWAKAKGVNNDIAQKTAEFIMECAAKYDTNVIVFEFLDTGKKKRGSKKQRLHHWKAQTVQRIVTDKAHRAGIRISRVCAWNTSRLAFDGSGTVTRGIDGNYSICRFKNGKIYNCDLSASYNIASRYFVREIVKALPAKIRLALEAKVPQVAKRSTCTYSVFISLLAELEELVLPADENTSQQTA